jgi:hypothetical protein
VVGSLQFSFLLAIQPFDGCITNRLLAPGLCVWCVWGEQERDHDQDPKLSKVMAKKNLVFRVRVITLLKARFILLCWHEPDIQFLFVSAQDSQ